MDDRINMRLTSRILMVVILCVHILLVCCYTFPRSIVPQRLQYLSTAYVRPLFHQKWELFAPDPPLCSPSMSCANSSRHFLVDRIHRNIASYAAGSGTGGVVPDVIRTAMQRSACGDELMLQCLSDAQKPDLREVRIVQLRNE